VGHASGSTPLRPTTKPAASQNDSGRRDNVVTDISIGGPISRHQTLDTQQLHPVIESLLMLGDFITAVLLFSQASIMRSAALVALGTAYFFSSLALIPHALTFPDAFSPTGLLGARVNTSAWLYLFWRPGLSAGMSLLILHRKRLDALENGWHN
jgi:hypothetical protein